jgi:hypothetical protein
MKARVIYRGLALAAVIWLLPAPAYAHAVGPGSGVEIELLMVAGAVLFFGVKLRSQKTAKPWAPWAVMALGVGLGVLSFALPQINKPTRPANISIQIASPEQGEAVPAGEPVQVRVDLTGVSIARSPTDTNKGHLHIYVDGQLQQMPYSTNARVTLKPGTHEVAVEYVDPQHVSYDPPIRTSVQVEAAEE